MRGTCLRHTNLREAEEIHKLRTYISKHAIPLGKTRIPIKSNWTKHSEFQNSCHMRHVLILYLFDSIISAHLLMHQLTVYVGLTAK
jgi:hypothetical protein